MKKSTPIIVTVAKIIKLLLLCAIFIVSLVYIMFTLFLYFTQDKYIFYPQPLNVQTTSIFKQYSNVDDISIKTPDDNVLNGWLIKSTKFGKAPLVIYFGGNSEEVSDMFSTANQINDKTWALINYRGYGSSSGSPSEKSLFNDSLLIYDYLQARKDVDNQKIIVFGRSLGSGVAVYLAQNRQVDRMILVTPYDSMTNIAQNNYPLIPVQFLLKNKFDSLSRVNDIKVPVLALAAGDDATIPLANTQRLVNALGEKCEFKIIPDTGHNTISNNDLYLDYLNQFLDR